MMTWLATLGLFGALILEAPPVTPPALDVPVINRHLARCHEGCLINYRFDKRAGRGDRDVFLQDCVETCRTYQGD